MQKHGISHQFSYPYASKQSGYVERKHIHLVDTARTLLATSKVPYAYWVDAFSTVVYLINRMSTATKCSPWESLFLRSPEYSTLRIFGCICFPWLKPYISCKLDPKSKSCVFLRYNLQRKGYKCLDFTIGKIYLLRNVLFDKVHFLFHHLQPNSVFSTTS